MNIQEQKFIDFDPTKGADQSLPPERKDVVLELAPFRDGLPKMYMIGYLRYAAGDKNSPQFILPGVPEKATVIAWADCLKEDCAPYPYQEAR